MPSPAYLSPGTTVRALGVEWRRESKRGVFMSDLVYVGIVVAFFVVSALYVRFCETL